MGDKVVSKRELSRKYRFKGKAPFRSDRIIAWWSKLLIQLLIFTIIYTIYIPGIRAKYNNFFIEFLFVFLWLMITDSCAYIIAIIIKVAYNYKMKYLPSGKKKGKNYNRMAWEYLFYTLFRCAFYLIGLTPLLISIFYSFMPILGGFFAYLLAWIIIFITSKIFATIISIAITKTI